MNDGLLQKDKVMTALILSVLVLFTAPIMTRLMANQPLMRSGFDGFVLIIAVGLVVLMILPEVFAHLGLLGLAVLVLGFALPSIAEGLLHRSADGTHRVSLTVASVALVLHAGGDGALLAAPQATGFDADSRWIAVSVLLHRFGIATTLWWLLRPYFSRGQRLAVLAAMGLATIVFYLFATKSADVLHADHLLDGLFAFAGGSLLHIVLHPLGQPESTAVDPGKMDVSHRIGTGLGLVFVTAMIATHTASHMVDHTFADRADHSTDALLSAGLHLAPYLLGLTIVWSVVYCLWPRAKGRGGVDLLRKAVESAAVVTFCLWVVASLVLYQLPHLTHALGHNHNMMPALIWLLILAAVLVRQGARPFLSHLIPHSHDHAADTHGHSH